MAIERETLEKLLGKYNTTFKLSEVEALLEGQPLPSTANATLLDIEQSIRPYGESVESPIPAGSSGNDNTE